MAGNLAAFIDRGLAVLIRVVPAFAGLLSQPRVLIRFHAMVGGDAAFGTDSPGESAAGDSPGESAAGNSPDESAAGDSPAKSGAGESEPGDGEHPRSLPDALAHYLRAEQRLGRINEAADVDAATQLIVGAIHGLVLPRVLVTPGQPITPPPGAGARLAMAAMGGLGPR